jgi:cob(I)alamin adenosyltransferase
MDELPVVHGLTVLFTGDGKGKTTAALGMLMRAHGHGLMTAVLQFMKTAAWSPGETGTASELGIDFFACGSGFTWQQADESLAIGQARAAWRTAQQYILERRYDLLVLDEFTYPLSFGWIKTSEAVAWLKLNKPTDMHLVLTGRYAPKKLIDYADLVTEMKEIKHPFHEAGLLAQVGVEY